MDSRQSDAYEKKKLEKLEKSLSLSAGTANNEDITKLRDSALATLRKERQSPYYLAIADHINDDNLTAREYIYYALTTNDVKTVNPEKLAASLAATPDLPDALHQNLSILIAALHFSQATDAEEKAAHHQTLINELSCYLPHIEYCVKQRATFLNLGGIQLTGFNSSKVNLNTRYRKYINLSFCDLQDAELIDCNVTCTTVANSNLHQATFSNIRMSPKYDFLLGNSIFNGTTFDHVDLNISDGKNCVFSDTRFSHSSIKGDFSNSKFINTIFAHTRLDATDHTTTVNALFDHCDFTTAELAHIDYARQDFRGSVFLNPKNLEELPAELDRLARMFVNGSYSYEKDRNLRPFWQAILTDVLRHIKSLSVDTADYDKNYREALKHDLFNYRYIESARALLPVSFPRQAVPRVFYDDYFDDAPYSVYLQDEFKPAYRQLHAYGMGLLHEFATAIKSPDTLDEYISEHKTVVLPYLMDKIRDHSSSVLVWLVSFYPELLFKIALYSTQQNAAQNHLAGLEDKLLAALLVTQYRFAHDYDDYFDKNPQLDREKMKSSLDRFHPLLNQVYYPASNCFAHKTEFRLPARAFHSADELIRELTSEARTKPVAVAVMPQDKNDFSTSTKKEVTMSRHSIMVLKDQKMDMKHSKSYENKEELDAAFEELKTKYNANEDKAKESKSGPGWSHGLFKVANGTCKHGKAVQLDYGIVEGSCEIRTIKP